MPHIFFSYAHDDAERVFPIHARMQVAIERYLWIDKTGLKQGIEWENAIRRAIDQSYSVIFAVTETFITRPFILEKEIPWAVARFADKQGPLLFPILLDNVSLPETLNIPFICHPISAIDANFEHVLAELIKTLPQPQDKEHNFIVTWPRLLTFRGRDQRLIELHEELVSKDATVSIKPVGLYGLGGIGKTQLAVEYAHRFRFHYPAGVYWINAAHDWETEFVNLADSLRLTPADASDSNRDKQMVFAFKEYLRHATDDALIILDNVENPKDVKYRDIAPNLSIFSLCEQTYSRLLVTTRRQNLPDSFSPFTVGLLSPEDSRQILLDARPGESDIDSLDKISTALGYLPLALGLAAAALQKRPKLTPTKFLENLRSLGIDQIADTVGVELGTPEEYAARVNVALQWHWERLESENARLLLQLISSYGEGAEVPTARLRLLSSIQDAELDQPFSDAIAELHNLNLVEFLENGETLRLHPLVRGYIRENSEYQSVLARGAVLLVNSLRDPTIIANETTKRGFNALVSDLRTTRLALLPLSNEQINILERIFVLEETNSDDLPLYGVANLSVSIMQQLRERAYHEQDHQLCSICDKWLDKRSRVYFQTIPPFQFPSDPALTRIFSIDDLLSTASTLLSDGMLVLSAGRDNAIRLYNLATGKVLRTLAGHHDTVNVLSVFSDGKRIISASDDNTLRLWDLETGEPIHVFEGHSDGIHSVIVFSNEEKIISASHDKTLILWDVNTGQKLKILNVFTGSKRSLAVLPDERKVVVTSYLAVSTVDLETGESVDVIKPRKLGSRFGALAVVDDRRILVAEAVGSHIHLCDIESGRILRTFRGHSSDINDVKMLNNSGKAISASFDKTLKLWEIESGKVLRTFEGHAWPVDRVEVLPHKQQIVSSSLTGTFLVWNLEETSTSHVVERHNDGVLSLVTIDLLHVLSASADKTLRMWDLDSGKTSKIYKGHTDEVNDVAFLSERRFLSASGDTTLRLWDLKTGNTLRTLKGHTKSVNAVATIPEQGWAVSASDDKTLRLWDLKSGKSKRIYDGHTAEVSDILLLPASSQFLSSAYDGTLRQWDIETGNVIRVVEAHKGKIYSMCYFPELHQVASVATDNTIRLWSLDTLEPTQVLEIPNTVPSDIAAFQRSGLLSVSGDGVLNLWDVVSGTSLATLRLDQIPMSITVLDDNRIAVGDWTGSIRVVRIVER